MFGGHRPPGTPAGHQQARSEVLLGGSAYVAHVGHQVAERPLGPPSQGVTNAAGVLRVRSVTAEPARRLDAVRIGKIKGTDRLQLVCERGFLEIVGQVVESRLVFTLEVEQGEYRILPAPRSRPAVRRRAVMQARLLCLAALSMAPLSLGVAQSHVTAHVT